MKPVARIERHKDGAIKARGYMLDGELSGYWEWFRKDGSKMRSGSFEKGKQVGEWTTYDAKGRVVKVTNFSH
jgi:antitoxin component YwqK of YwqJK toxin-antitoxin module